MYWGIGHGKNVLVIQVEALQNFVLNATYNGQVLTPNLNAFLKDDCLQFTNHYYQAVSYTHLDVYKRQVNKIYRRNNDNAPTDEAPTMLPPVPNRNRESIDPAAHNRRKYPCCGDRQTHDIRTIYVHIPVRGATYEAYDPTAPYDIRAMQMPPWANNSSVC